MNIQKCHKNVWLFSGASSGIGKEWVKEILNNGGKVIGVTRNINSLSDLKDKYKNNFMPIEANITDVNDLELSIDKAMNSMQVPYISHVVCAAGFAHFGTIEDVSPEELLENFKVNLIGARNLAILGLKRMAPSGDRRIIFVSSMAGLHCWPNLGVYQISKFGVRALSETLRVELESKGIQVGCLYLGPHIGTGWLTTYAKRTPPSSGYSASWLEKSTISEFEHYSPEGAIPVFDRMITETPMPSAATGHQEVALLFKKDSNNLFKELDSF